MKILKKVLFGFLLTASVVTSGLAMEAGNFFVPPNIEEFKEPEGADKLFNAIFDIDVKKVKELLGSLNESIINYKCKRDLPNQGLTPAETALCKRDFVRKGNASSDSEEKLLQILKLILENKKTEIDRKYWQRAAREAEQEQDGKLAAMLKANKRVFPDNKA